MTTDDGVPIDFAIASGHIDDREVLRVLSQGGRYPIVLGDKGYVSHALRQELRDAENMCLLPTLRSNQKPEYPEAFGKLHARLRRRIETTLNQLTHQFSVGRVRARTHWGLQTRMSNKFGACLLGAFLNQALGRPLMKLRDLVLA